MQPGDVIATFADISALDAAVGFRPKSPIEIGLKTFVQWNRDYYRAPVANA